jgi:hypothetical protein
VSARLKASKRLWGPGDTGINELVPVDVVLEREHVSERHALELASADGASVPEPVPHGLHAHASIPTER